MTESIDPIVALMGALVDFLQATGRVPCADRGEKPWHFRDQRRALRALDCRLRGYPHRAGRARRSPARQKTKR